MEKFTAPKHIGAEAFFNCKRVPRKFKKKNKELLNKFPFLDLNQKLWFILRENNKEYSNFLIKEICKKN